MQSTASSARPASRDGVTPTPAGDRAVLRPPVGGPRRAAGGEMRRSTRRLPIPTPHALALGGLFLATRLPGFSAGFGADGDYWHVAALARRWLAGAGYAMARAPGNPLHEAQTAAALWLAQRLPWGPESLWAGLWTLLWSALLVGLFCRLAIHVEVPRERLTAALLLLLLWPIFWAHGADGSDHVPAAFLALGAVELTLAHHRGWRRPLLAGALLGLAAGYRLGSLALAPACALALLLPPAEAPQRRFGRRGIAFLLFSVAAALTTAVVFWPVWSNYSWAELHPAVRHHSLLGLAARVGVRGAEALAPGLVLPLLLWVLLRRWRTARPRTWLTAVAFRRFASPGAGRRAQWVLGTVIVASLLVFAPLPLDPAYLLPAAVASLLLLARHLAPRQLYALCGAALLAALIEPTWSRPTGATPLGGFSWQPGPVLGNLRGGRAIRDYPEQLLAVDFAPGTLVIGARAIEGAGGEDFQAPPGAPGWRRNDRAPGVGFAGYRLLADPSAAAIALRRAGFLRIAIDRAAVDRARREADLDLEQLALESGLPFGVFALESL